MDIKDKFKTYIEFEKMSLVDTSRFRKSKTISALLFPEDLDDTVVSELIHLKSHLAILDMRQPNKRVRFRYVSGCEKKLPLLHNPLR